MRDHRVTCAPIARGARLALIAAAALAAGACSSSSGDGGGGSADAVSDVASDAGVGAGDAGSGPVDDLGRPADDAGTQADTGSPADAGGPQDAGGDGLAPSEDTAPSEDVMPSDDISGAADITPSDDSSAPEDVIAPEDVMPSDDIAPPEDVMPSDDIAPPEDGWQPEVEQPAIEPATLLLEDQVLDKPFDVVIVKVAQLPSTATQAGTLRLRIQGGDDDGLVAGTKLLAYGTLYEDLEIELVGPVVASQLFVADILDGAGEPFPGVDGTPLAVTFSVTGDSENPELVVDTQDVDPDDLYGLEISRVYVPERFPQGIWLAVYEDADGVPGALRGKQKFMPGLHEQTPFALTNKLIMGRQLHAIMRTPVPGSGSWTNTGAIIEDLSGQPMTAQFFADSLAFNPILEVEDQELVQADEVVIKKVVVPVEYIGGGWVAIYADDNGSPGELLGNKYFNKGTKEDQILDLDVALEGDNTLHAVLHAGQTWAVAKDIVMVAPGGGEMTLTFKVGAQDLSYIDAAPYTTDDPRHVVVKRAYSFHKPAWVVLARDEGGQPGTVIARKKILQKFAGNVHFTVQTNDFLTSGTAAEYLTGQPGTFRRCARGDDLLHVMLYEDDPQDGEFTYTPGGTEDLPVLDAEDNPVTELLEVTVAASIKNVQKDSERYYLPCPLSQHVGNPTSLPVDCRCHANIQTLDFPECKAVIADGLDMSFGAGPRVRTQNFGHFRSGFVETDTQELIALAVWKDYETVWPENQVTIDVAAVMAIDVETRERRIVGGRYKDPATGIEDIGTGPVLSYPFEIQKGPDGYYYIASYGYVRIDASLTPTVDVIRMNPATGDREYVWRSNHLGYNFDNAVNPYGHCANGRTEKYGYYSVQIGRKGFGIDDSGNFYLSYAHNGYTPTSDGIGIIKVGADGSTCEPVTRTKVGVDNVLYQGQSIGAGVEPQAGPYKGMLVKDGKLYVSTELNGDLYEIDIATGDRTALHIDGSDSVSGSNGTHVVWDHHRQLIWQAGLSNSTLLYDPALGTSEPLWCPENYRDYKGISCLKIGAWGHNGLLLERGLWIHPTNPEYAFVVNGAMIQRVDLKAGTSEIFSY